MGEAAVVSIGVVLASLTAARLLVNCPQAQALQGEPNKNIKGKIWS